MVPDVADETVKALNALQFGAPDKKPQTEPARRALMAVVWNTMPGFEALAQWDELGALSLVEKIKSVELRTVAGLGAAKGILGSATTGAGVRNKPATKL
jgi:hypothetical protein